MYSFSEGLSAVKKNEKWGYINKKGKVVIQFKYDEVYNFFEGLAIVKIKNKYGIIDKKGKVVIPIKYDAVTTFSEGLIGVGVEKQGMWFYGYINKKGKHIDFFNFAGISIFSEGLGAVASYLGGKWGFINKKGEIVIQPEYDAIDDDYRIMFKNGYVIIKKNGELGRLSKNGVFTPFE